MGITKGSVASRNVSIQWQDGEAEKYKKIAEKNNLTDVDALCSYYEKQGVEIDYGCSNRWPIGGPKAKQDEYFLCKAANFPDTVGEGTGSCSMSKASEDALAAQADSNAKNQAENDKQSDETANKEQSAAADAAEKGAEKAEELLNIAKDIAESAADEASQRLANMNGLSSGATALATTALSKAGMFSLPNVQIPKFELPKINEHIEKITDTYKPDKTLSDEVNVLKDQLSKIEEIRNSLEGSRLGEMAKELADNAKLEDKYLDDLKALGGVVDKTFDSAIGGEDSVINNALDALANAPSLSEAMAEAANAAANGELMSADTVAEMVDSLSNATSDVDSTMKAVFGDSSGKASEAVGKADTANEVPARGNGPCGKKTKNVGGVNYNDPEKEKGEEDANKKAYYMKLFEDACKSGNMDLVEKYYKILTEEYNESPELLKKSMAELPESAPQTKAGIARVTDLFNDANNKLESFGVADKDNQFSVTNAYSDSIDEIGNGASWVYDQSKNMVKSLFGSEDDASKQILAKDFVKSNAQAEMVNQMTN